MQLATIQSKRCGQFCLLGFDQNLTVLLVSQYKILCSMSARWKCTEDDLDMEIIQFMGTLMSGLINVNEIMHTIRKRQHENYNQNGQLPVKKRMTVQEECDRGNVVTRLSNLGIWD